MLVWIVEMMLGGDGVYFLGVPGIEDCEEAGDE
jgi:hypothetical protein